MWSLPQPREGKSISKEVIQKAKKFFNAVQTAESCLEWKIVLVWQKSVWAFLCVPFKIPERLIYACVETIIDSLLLREQAGFRHRRSTIDQVTMLKQDIKDNFTAKKRAGAVFVDLTAAYDTVWHHGLPDRHMVRMIMKMVGNRSFTLTTGNGKRSFKLYAVTPCTAGCWGISL